MNIITKPYGSEFYYIKPDMSRNRDCDNYFCPDNITELAAVPFLYTRIEKAGKAIASKFAERYYSTIGYGIQLVATSLINKEDLASIWVSQSLDNTAYFSSLSPIANAQNVIEALLLWDNNCKDTIAGQLISKINSTIESISKYSSIKTGDYVVLELLPQQQSHTITLQQSNINIKLGELNFYIIA
ncbi:MAG: hypothetical protein RR555_07145 [Bacteroidales bacterium]